jgi:peptidyl-prolyl cis-trans isomerase D
MMKLLRRHKDWLMIVIAILAIPFIFYFVKTPDYGAMRSDVVGPVYGRKVPVTEIQGYMRLGTLAQVLGASEFWQMLSVNQPGDRGYEFFALNLLVLRHEADQLGIRPSYAEIANAVRTLPAFQGDSGFDMKKFTDFTQNALAPLGLNEEHIEQLVRDQLSLDQIKKLLAAGITVPKGELDENFARGNDTLSVTVIRFQSADFAKDITVSDEDIKKHYDAHKAELKSDEKRKVEFVSLALTDEEKKLTGKERVEVLQKLSDRATDFTQALLEKGADFKQAAAKSQLPVRETGEFTKAEPDPQLKADPALSAAAFKLSTQEPNSDPVQVADGFYILHLAGITEARPLTLEEAKPKIVDTIKKSKAHELMSTRGAEIVQQLREAKQSGQLLEAAIQKAGGKVEKIPPFSIIEEEKSESKDKEPKNNEPADLPFIKQAVAFLNQGETSDFFPAGEGGFVAILEKREPLAGVNASEKKVAFEKRLLDNKRRIVLMEWLRDRGQEAGLQFTKG